jgi:hypothetical protein
MLDKLFNRLNPDAAAALYPTMFSSISISFIIKLHIIKICREASKQHKP